ncbi:phage portal protein [Shewanella algae]|uniref:phage portal protein n=1 Tax=Shewanella algae TaxID=38313 RepID=UPI001AAEBD87|nr:phage portal protein [Shewanella algae]MBO2580224.1 phage portal protein [Shewanella algae]HDS1207811.1 phage portal protein [Shewanella algae]
MKKTKSNDGLLGAFKTLFRGYQQSDADDASIAYDSVGSVGMPFPADSDLVGDNTGKLNKSSGWLPEYVLPKDRMSRYAIYQMMGNNELISAALQMHIAHALAPDMETGNILTIESADPEFKELADEVMEDLGAMINDAVASWAMPMAQYGVHYLRPYGAPGVGITDIESNWFTLAHQVKEYERAGLLCGFVGEYLKKFEGDNLRLAEPWALVGCKIPFWTPDLDAEPPVNGPKQYSLYDDVHRRKPVETQNYGTSFLENSYTAYMEFNETLGGLRGARFAASKTDRIVGIGMDGLDPISAANYLNQVGTQFKKDIEAEREYARINKSRPSIFTRLIPLLTGGKGGMTVDTQQTSPNINGIEDVIFNLKRLCSSLGIDPSMIGWADMMSGGLGEGGWARTSIIAAMRAIWIRNGIRDAVMRIIEIHLAFKYKKAFPRNKLPFTVKFHSVNTALAIEKADENRSKIEFCTSVVTLMDMMMQGTFSGSETFKKMMMGEAGLDNDTIETVLSEIAKNPPSDGEGMFEGVEGGLDEKVKALVNSHLVNLWSE